jgi:CRP/FNR family cyclic AMP-dependent transcriptional regulator
MSAVPAREGVRRPGQRLLDVDPDMAGVLPAETVDAAAVELVVPTQVLARGNADGYLGGLSQNGHFGLLLVDGLLLRELTLAGGTSGELLGQGDLLRPWEMGGEEAMPVPAEARWTALTEVTVAPLSGDFMRRAARYPEVLSELAGRSVRRTSSLMLRQAITNLKHVETRLLMLFWHLAERWGRMGRSEITLELPLTHELLGTLVGATRPSVTTALGQLDRRGLLVRGGASSWRLRREVGDVLESLDG